MAKFSPERIFTYHPPFGDQAQRYERLRARAKELALDIQSMCPESREKSLAFTNLQQSIMFANAAIAINEDPVPSESTKDVAARLVDQHPMNGYVIEGKRVSVASNINPPTSDELMQIAQRVSAGTCQISDGADITALVVALRCLHQEIRPDGTGNCRCETCGEVVTPLGAQVGL